MTTGVLIHSSAVTLAASGCPAGGQQRVQEGRERERKKKGAWQARTSPDEGSVTTSCSHSQPLLQHPDQTTTRLTFCSVSIPFRLQMFINTCCNVISSWENTHQVMDADKSVKQMSPPCPSLLPPSQPEPAHPGTGRRLLPRRPSSPGKGGPPSTVGHGAGDSHTSSHLILMAAP